MPRALAVSTRSGLTLQREPRQGGASFNLIRYRRHDDSTFLYAFDLIELNGDGLRRDPLEVRKATLASIVEEDWGKGKWR